MLAHNSMTTVYCAKHRQHLVGRTASCDLQDCVLSVLTVGRCSPCVGCYSYYEVEADAQVVTVLARATTATLNTGAVHVWDFQSVRGR